MGTQNRNDITEILLTVALNTINLLLENRNYNFIYVLLTQIVWYFQSMMMLILSLKMNLKCIPMNPC